jgi:hypothetical protein
LRTPYTAAPEMHAAGTVILATIVLAVLLIAVVLLVSNYGSPPHDSYAGRLHQALRPLTAASVYAESPTRERLADGHPSGSAMGLYDTSGKRFGKLPRRPHRVLMIGASPPPGGFMR